MLDRRASTIAHGADNLGWALDREEPQEDAQLARTCEAFHEMLTFHQFPFEQFAVS